MDRKSGTKFMAVILGAVVLGTAGCATKKFVRQSLSDAVHPLQAGIRKVDQKTAENAEQIRNVDRRSETGISNAQNSADQANQAAGKADQHAQAAQQVAQKGVTEAQTAQEMANNIDNYKPSQQTTVLFAIDKSTLTSQDKQRLDQIAQTVKPLKHYVIQVRGYTDSTGPKALNLRLSESRAGAVVRYLTLTGEVPLVRIYSLGYGEAAPVNPNNTRAGRKLNRRVDVTVLVPQMPTPEGAQQSAQMSSPGTAQQTQ
ncbi:MAG: OmpA family protein [Terriglobia bacterium]